MRPLKVVYCLFSIACLLAFGNSVVGTESNNEGKESRENPESLASVEHVQNVPAPTQTTPHVITWFFRPLHTMVDEAYGEDELAAIIATLGASHKNLLQQRRRAQIISGIPVLYKGGLSFSDENGQILLPRLHEDDTLTIVVTERPQPVIEHGNTVEHWVLKTSLAANWYTCVRTRGSDSSHKAVWTITQIFNDEIRIPIDAIIILAPPTVINIPEGTMETDFGFNLIVPDFYVDERRMTMPPAFNQIAINRFFESTRYLFAYAPELLRYSVMISP